MQWMQTATGRYSLYGTLFGLLFPIIATGIDVLTRGLPFSFSGFWQAQQTQSLHWIIDTAPLFLGLFASFAGKRQDSLQASYQNVIKTNQQLQLEIEVRKEAEKQQETYAKRLQERNTDLDAFAGTVAHDLKSPLTPIIGMARLLESRYGDVLDEQGRVLTNRIAQNGEKAVEIINSLLLLTSLHKEFPEYQPLDMDKIVNTVLARVQDTQEKYGATVQLPQSWGRASGHAPWVEQVWINYLTNAFKYGGKTPEVKLNWEQIGTDYIRYYVQDSGTGLSKMEQAQLFTAFMRLRKEADVEGHGLGLSIVKRVVERLGGEVGVESLPNAGSCFWFTLPVHSTHN